MFSFGIAVAIFSFLILLISTWTIFPLFPDAVGAAGTRVLSFVQPLVQRFFGVEPYAVFASIALASLYALICSIVVFFFFEKTLCHEILFFTFFALSFCLESFRFVIPLCTGLNIPWVYAALAGRVILFGRFFGILSFCAASIYAAGFQTQKQSNIILVSIVLAMIVAIGIPVDALSWDSGLNINVGYSIMLGLSEAGVFAISAVSFFVGAYSRGSREFIPVGIGSILVFFGRNILLNCDTWVSLPIAAALLAVGTWFVCSRLHRIYLWL